MSAIRSLRAGPAMPERRRLDYAHLRRQCLDDEDLAAEILCRFRLEARAAARRLATGDRVSAAAGAEVAHRLRGAALGVGAFAVARAAEAVEARGRAAAGSAAMAAEVARLCEAVALATAEIDGLHGGTGTPDEPSLLGRKGAGQSLERSKLGLSAFARLD